ncbi:MAG TPA: ATPase [Acidobacteriota bacterium]|nr:ATPase [Acidobacteriota bacterium]
MILLDSGTSYAKIFDTRRGNRMIVPAKDLAPDFHADIACGHNVGRRSDRVVNELVALARGALRMTGEEDFVVVDVGGRDTKFVRIGGRRYDGCDWNSSCGALSGFTIEMLGRYYGIDFAAVEPVLNGTPITCGVFGMSTMFDQIINGKSPAEAIAGFVRGAALSVYNFCGRPERLLLSGGLCDNPLALRSFPCEVTPLGRFALLEGLRDYISGKS